MDEILKQAHQAKEASYSLSNLSCDIKNNALLIMAEALVDSTTYIVEQNQLDVDNAQKNGKSKAFLDRLKLDEGRIKAMAEGLKSIAQLPDPIGETIAMWRRPNGLEIGQRRVPLGVIGIIYEARPNVTADAVGLCLKTGNAVILRGGSDAIHSNGAIVDVLSKVAYDVGIPKGSFSLVKDTRRESVEYLMKLNGLIDVLIPRGGVGLIENVIQNATIPVIETGIGNCHIYVDSDSEQDMAKDIVINAKIQRPGVCNAVETLLVDEKIAQQFIPEIVSALTETGVEIRGCEKTRNIVDCVPAKDDDWYKEYLDYILAIKIVDGIDEAISHINIYGSGHSEAIVTSNYFKAKKFLNEVDAAAVYVNASTRFTDGFEYGFGAEIGISTQKLHARGPMGLNALTTIKYVINGNGQIRS